MTARIVLLNGVGSVGKSSTAKALQRIVERPMLHVSMDAFLDMLPPGAFGNPDYYRFETWLEAGAPVTAVRSGPVLQRLTHGMRRVVAALAADGLDVVVDDVFWGDDLADYRAVLAPYAFHAVGLFAPLDVLEARERTRGDRDLGLARWQFAQIRPAAGYDLEIDTNEISPEEAAARIKATFGL
ncbi:MAG TPA: AAA family ATPase [Caulobacteraceae bacterium]|nr:AAA family ATPase [Caulobacteraceae bacterium]